MKAAKGRGPSRIAGLFLSIMNAVPLKWRIIFFDFVFRFLYFLDDRHRRIARRNLTIAFPEKDPNEIEKVVRLAFRNLGRVAAEFFIISRLKKENLHQYLIYEGLENFFRAQEKGKGVLFLTAHFGNWEWMAAGFPLVSHHSCHVVFRPLDNRFLNDMVERVRTATGNHTIPKQRAMGYILRLLKEGKTVGILLDQNMDWYEGVFINFFGELACTNKGMALLALKTGTPVLPVFNIRQRDGRYRIIIEPEVPLFRTGNKDGDVTQNTQLYSQVIERYIRDYPDHWLWFHQRWKTRPWRTPRMKAI
jgi:KDO2-lipid IV(A) lauroyltransferase